MRRITIFSTLVILALLLGGVWLDAQAASLGQEGGPDGRLRPDHYTFVPEPPPLQNVEQARTASPDGVNLPQVYPWGRITFQSYDGDWEIAVFADDGAKVIYLTDNTRNDMYPRLNRGASKIVFSSEQNQQYELYVMNADGSRLNRLTTTPTNEVRPVWSPDGTRIAYQGYVDGQADIFVMNADGSNPTRLTWDADYDGIPTWSPDGSRIAFVSHRSGGYRVWVMKADGSNPAQLSNQAYSSDPVWSPDGSRIVYDAADDGGLFQDLWVMNADGSGQQLMIDAGVNSSDYIASGWSPDGWNVLYTYINYINYNGTWYWTEAIMRAVAVSGFFNSVTLNPMREMDWRPDWQTLDVYAPTVGINPLASVSTAQFTVSWWGADEQSGLRDYTVQVRDGVGGAWMDWQVNTGATSADFTGLGGHTYYFRVRSRDNHVNVSSWTPDDQVFTTVESEAPVTRLETLPDFLRQLDVTLVWAGYDPGGSGIASYDVQYRDGLNGDWTMLLDDSTATTYDFQGQYGHTYFFRLRGQDAAQNVEAWGPETENPTTTLYAWKISGTTTDNTGLPLEGVDVMIDPHPFLDLSSDEQGQYKAYLSSNPAAKRVSWSRAEYLGLPETDLMGESDVSFDVVMPPGDNLVQNWGFEGGSLAPAWQAGGIFTPVVTADAHHTGQSAVRLGEGYTFGLTETVVPNLEVSYYDGMVQDANGILHIVWRRSDTEYYAQRDLAGNWSVAEEVVSVGSWDSAVHLAVSSDGVVHLVWNDDGLIGYSWRDLDGVWSSPQTLSGDSGGREVVYLDKNNVFHIVWYENDIVYYMQRPAGGDWSAVEQVPAGGYFFSVNFAVGAAGDVYLAWGNGPNLAHRDITGTWSLQRFDFGWGIARVVIDASDRVHLIWTNQVTDYDSGLSQDYLYYAYGDVGDELGEPQILFEGINVEKIDAGVDHNDNLHFILEGTTLNFAYSSVYYIKIDRAGNWTQPVDIEQPAVEPADYIQMAVSENGEVFVLVEQMLQNEYYASVPEVHLLYLSQGRWSEPINISQSRGTSVSSSMAVSDTGMVHIVWAESAKGVIYRGYLPSKGGTSWLSQPITLTQGVNAPVLSFFYQLSGADDQANTGLSVQVSNSLTTTLLYSTTDNVDWTHAWFDLSPWLGQTITLTFQTNTIAGVAPVRLYLDEVTIGSSYPDVWATFAGAQAGLPGDQITLQLAYGNRGGALAENAAITLTLPADLSYVGASQPPAAVGQMLTWEVGDLAAGSGPYTIDVTVEVDANAIPGEWLVSQAVIHAASPELEALNNTAQVRTLVGKLLFLPVISR